MPRHLTLLTAREKRRVTVNKDEVKLVVETAYVDGIQEDDRYGTVLVMEVPRPWNGSLHWVDLTTGSVIRVQQSISEVLQLLDDTAETQD